MAVSDRPATLSVRAKEAERKRGEDPSSDSISSATAWVDLRARSTAP